LADYDRGGGGAAAWLAAACNADDILSDAIMLQAMPLLLASMLPLLSHASATGADVPGPPPPFVGPCSFSEGLDCDGQDIKKIPGDPKTMTQAQCCKLCKAEPGCKVAVLATGWQNGQNLCELKSGCDHPHTGMSHRVKCCLPGAPGNEGCHGGGGGGAFACKKDVLPTFCDPTKRIDDRVAELVSKMTPEEKIAQVGSNGVPDIDRLGIPAYQWWGEAQHGVCSSPSVKFVAPTPVGTSFPEPGLTGATFDKELFSTVGDVIGKEGRAMANAGNAGLTFWAPNINIVRDPRWGRLLETPGEDPYLTSMYAIHFIKGVQGVDPTGRGYLQAASTPKHYAGYNFDSWHGMDRYHYNALISKQDWADTYSQPFQASVVGANASGLMCSYNALNGTPTCASSDLMTKLAREEYGFDGYITGDCGAADDVWTAHNYGGDAAGAAAASITAGMDVDCGAKNTPSFFGAVCGRNRSFCQDRLGTNIGNVEGKRVAFCAGHFVKDNGKETPFLRLFGI
jgi:beta-glucosidase-like glycosyl hydrolase